MTLSDDFAQFLIDKRGETSTSQHARDLGVCRVAYIQLEKRRAKSVLLSTVERYAGMLGYDVRLVFTRKRRR